jgi:hypothetical protein
MQQLVRLPSRTHDLFERLARPHTHPRVSVIAKLLQSRDCEPGTDAKAAEELEPILEMVDVVLPAW